MLPTGAVTVKPLLCSEMSSQGLLILGSADGQDDRQRCGKERHKRNSMVFFDRTMLDARTVSFDSLLNYVMTLFSY